MSVLVVYGRLYAACIGRAARSIRKSPWTLLLPAVYLAAIVLAGRLLGGLGLLAGILSTLAVSALFASYLYFVGELAADARVHVAEVGRSFAPYFWATVNLGFVVWIVELLLGFALARNPQAAVLLAIVHFAEFVLLNAAAEVIYTRHTYGGLATVQRTIAFIHENWIEWFIPNLALGAAFYYGLPALAAAGVPDLVLGIVVGAVFHLAMVFRGVLFAELDSSAHRQRMFKYRSQS